MARKSVKFQLTAEQESTLKMWVGSHRTEQRYSRRAQVILFSAEGLRLEQISQQGDSPFFKYQLPEAILKFKQGFGRLIRSRTDKGIVVILDPRVVTKRYGNAFLKALPSCPVEIVTAPDE